MDEKKMKLNNPSMAAILAEGAQLNGALLMGLNSMSLVISVG